MERHRLAYVVATSRIKLDYSQVLHVAPERQLEKVLRSQADDYLSIDLYASNVMAKMDVTSLDLEDDSQTLVWISHVLEHVERDDLAISEINRVLRESGIALVQVPVWREKTYEDFFLQTKDERLRSIYQPDHVGLYGMDIIERFERGGFEASVVRAQDFGPDKLIEQRLSFASTNEVFIFTKRWPAGNLNLQQMFSSTASSRVVGEG